MTPDGVIGTLAGLVRIPSVNAAYEGGTGEADIARFVEQFFRDRGIETRVQEAFPGGPNVIARLPGRGAGRLVLEAHMDTASATGMQIEPFDPVISGGRLYGRGACDTKAGLAAMMHALAGVRRDGAVPPCEIWVVGAADEEYSFRGVTKLAEGLAGEGAVVAEPTEMRLAIASKGALRWRIRCRGKAAHSSKPELGVNAIVNMARLVLLLEEDRQKLKTRYHPLLGNPACNIGVIEGGRQVNFVPDFCIIEIDRRLLPGETIAGVLEDYQRLLDGHPELDAVMEPPMLEDGPLETGREAKIVRCASEALAGVGLNPEPVGVPYGSDASKLGRVGIPSVIFGPGSIDQAHAAVEYVECEQVEQAEEFYRALMLRFE